jgi:hypothetical protein
MRQIAVPPLGARPAGEEDHEQTVLPDEESPPRGMSRLGWVVFVLVVVTLVVVATIIVLAVAVPWEYPQHVSFSLDAGNAWENTVCIPTGDTYWGGPGSILVSFHWGSSDNSPVRLTMGATAGGVPQPVAYNVTASSGSGSYQASGDGNNVYLAFAAMGAPTLPTFVNVTVSYDMPGHVIGGPAVPGTC